MSTHIRLLEASTGAALVVRAGCGVTLTEAGRRNLLHADVIADRLAAADRTWNRWLGSNPDVCGSLPSRRPLRVLLPPVFAATLRRAPGLEIHLDELEPLEAEVAVRDGTADLALVFRHEQDAASVEGDLLRQPLTRDPVSLSCRPRVRTIRPRWPSSPGSGGSAGALAAAPICCDAQPEPVSWLIADEGIELGAGAGAR